MPNIKSAIKRVKKSEKRRLRNSMIKSDLRTAVKKVNVAIDNKDQEAVKDLLINATKKLDKAASKGVIHKNKAARLKSRLMKKANALNA